MDWYEPIDTLYCTKHTVIYKAKYIKNSSSRINILNEEVVIVKTHAERNPSFERLNGLRKEFNIARSVYNSNNSSNIAEYLVLLERRDEKYEKVAIIMRDTSSRNLASITPRLGFDVNTFFKIAIQVTKGIRSIHNCGIVHQDIKPSNIILDESGNARVIDFGCGTKTNKEQDGKNVDVEPTYGTLSYVSPEQTGRTNHKMDFRTDFYSLGITFYHMLTGSVPFVSNSISKLYHLHIATNLPQLPSHLPQVLNSIVNKLANKNPQDRYQTANGLLYDLELLQHRLSNSNTEPFEICTRDFYRLIDFGNQLYGREESLQQIQSSFQKTILHKRVRVEVVKGYSGMGKSSLVSKLLSTIKKSNVAIGKYDQLERNITLSAIGNALQTLLAEMISNSNQQQLECLQTKFIDFFKEEPVYLLVEMVPSLSIFLDSSHQLYNKPPPVDAKNIIIMLFCELIRFVSNLNHSLVLFLDDMQWADMESLNLIKMLFETTDYCMLLILSYRDDQLTNDDNLSSTIDVIRDVVPVGTTTLNALDIQTLSKWISDLVHCDTMIDPKVVQIIHGKTGGNPFYVKLLIKTLFEDRTLWYDISNNIWKWNMNALRSAKYSDDLVDLMIAQINKFSGTRRDVLTWLACFGKPTKLFKLASIMNMKDDQELIDVISPLVSEDLLLFVGNEICFSHDKVRETVYAELELVQRALKHNVIAQNLRSDPTRSTTGRDLCELVNHMNQCKSLIRHGDHESLLELLRYNISAGLAAQKTFAFSISLNYYKTAVDLFFELYDQQEDCWSHFRDLGFESHMKLATSYLQLDNYSEATIVFDMLLTRAISRAELVAVYNKMI
ncbi:hybrid signal transduction histidine kinase dhkG [Acrasis kona]|uniref:Hybrid signal transduction histidine kinase dhkG n=1 Tax=Acrasis kona TaxID=1008807 RepID=A0AAW2YGZ0_9EUKA